MHCSERHSGRVQCAKAKCDTHPGPRHGGKTGNSSDKLTSSVVMMVSSSRLKMASVSTTDNVLNLLPTLCKRKKTKTIFITYARYILGFHRGL